MNGFYERNSIRHDNVSEDDRAQHINKDTGMKKLSMLIVISVLMSAPALAQVDATTVQTATQTAQKAYEAVTGNDARDVDWSTFEVIQGMKDPATPGHKLRVLQWEGFNPGYRTYDRVRVLVNDGGSTVGAEVLYMSR